MSRRGDDLVYAQRYSEAVREYESALTTWSDHPDDSSVPLRIKTLQKLGEVRQHYLDDPQGALRAYRSAADLAPGTEDAFEVRLRAARLLRDRLTDASAAAVELANL